MVRSPEAAATGGISADPKERSALFVRNTGVSLAAYAGATVLSVVLNAMVARLMGPTGKGAYTLLTLFALTIGVIVNLGLGQSAVYYYGKGRDTAAAIAANLLTAGLLIGAATSLVLVVSLPLYANEAFRGVPRSLIVMIAACAPALLAKLFAEYIFGALHDFLWNSGLNFVDLALRIALLTALLPALPALTAGTAGIALASYATAAVAWWQLRKRVGVVRLRLDRELLHRFAIYGAQSYGAVFMTYLNLRFDQFLVGFFLSLSDVGLYSVAVVVAELTLKLANVIAKVLFANVAAMDEDTAARLTNRTMRTTLWLAVLTAMGIAIAGPWVIRLLFGTAFAGATASLWLLLPGTVLFNITQVLYSDVSGRGYPAIGIHASVLSLAITIIGNVVLTPRMGIAGAALTSTFAYGAGAILVLIAYRRITRSSLRDILVPRADDVAAAKAILARLLQVARAPQNASQS